MFLPQGPLESGLHPAGSVEQYAGSIIFPAKPRTHLAEFGKIAGNWRHIRINTDTAAARSRKDCSNIINWAAQ